VVSRQSFEKVLGDLNLYCRSFIPLLQCTGLRLFPYAVVRVLDELGQQALKLKAETLALYIFYHTF
jgi:hypothetical protein